MKESIFKKDLQFIGPVRTVAGVITVRMYYSHNVRTGTHAGTHEDYQINVPTHLITCDIEGEPYQKHMVETEQEVLETVARVQVSATKEMQERANREEPKSFVTKMKELGFN